MNNSFHPTQSAADAADKTPTESFAAIGGGPADATAGSAAPAALTRSRARRRRRRWPIIAGVTAVALVGGGTVVYANVHKTVTLDVDGKVTKVSTFAGSVGGVLKERDITIDDHDEVVPATNTSLKNNADIVVRSGHEVTLEADGKQTKEWVAALDANEALGELEARGSEVALVASRSDATGRTTLPLKLDAVGPIKLVVDKKTVEVEDGSLGIEAILDSQKVALGELDRVSIRRDDSNSDDPQVSLVVQRVKVEDVTTTAEIPFQTETQDDPTRYKDLAPVVKQEGTAGVHTTVAKVTTVDGVEESRETLSDAVTTPAVNKIVVQGTKERPKATPKATKKATPKPTPSAIQEASEDNGSEAAPAQEPAAEEQAEPETSSVGGGVWAALARCESGGNPSIVSSNGKYHGLYQFSVGTWRAVGGTGLPSQASAAEQTKRAQILQARSGWGQWPACSRKLGLR